MLQAKIHLDQNVKRRELNWLMQHYLVS